MWPIFLIFEPAISGMAEAANFKFCMQIDYKECYAQMQN